MKKNVIRNTFIKGFSVLATLGMLLVVMPKTYTSVKAESMTQVSQEDSKYELMSTSDRNVGKMGSDLRAQNLLGGWVYTNYDNTKGRVDVLGGHGLYHLADQTIYFYATPIPGYGIKEMHVWKCYYETPEAEEYSYKEIDFEQDQEDPTLFSFYMRVADIRIDVDFQPLELAVTDQQGADNSFVYGEGGTAKYDVTESYYLKSLSEYNVLWYSEAACTNLITPNITTDVNEHGKLEFTVGTDVDAGDYYFTASWGLTVSNAVKVHVEKANQDAPVGVSTVPVTTAGGTDGQITNVTSEMEYSTDKTNWTSITGTSVTGLDNGTYYVRYKEKANYFASPEVSVEVLDRFSVVFDMQGHGTQVSQQDVVDKLYATKPAQDPSEAGWLFKGWFEQPGCTSAFNFATTQITQATTIYAKWIEDLKDAFFTFVAPQDLVYDGQAKQASVTTSLETGAITIKYFDASGTQVTPINVGTYTVKIDVAANSIYPAHTDITNASWTFSIVPSNTMTISIEGYEGTYDGQSHQPGTPVCNVTEGTTIEYSIDGGTTWSADVPSITNYGTVNAKVRATNPNYVTATQDFTLVVNRKDVEVSVESVTKEYGDSDPRFTVTITGRVSEFDKIEYVLTRDSGEDVGDYNLTLTADAEQGNYNVSCTSGILTIEASDDLSISCESYSGVYDGIAHSPVASVNVTRGTEIEYSVDGGSTWSVDAPSLTNVGKIDVIARATNLNYVTDTVSYSIEVTQKEVTVKAKDTFKAYGDVEPTLEAEVTGLVEGESVDYSLSRQAGEACGEYTITVTAAENQGNYHVSKENGKFTISKVDTLTVFGDNVSAKYDGNKHSGTASSNVVSGTTIYYSTDNATWSNKAPEFTNAGTYTVYLKATNSNFSDAFGSFTVTIAKRSIVITTGSANAVFSGVALTNEYYELSGDGFIAGQGISLVSTSKLTKVGQIDNDIQYKANAGTDLNNYDIKIVRGKLVVVATDPMKDTENINKDNVKKTDKDELEKARQDFEKLVNAPDNTPNEKKDAEENLQRIKDALQLLEDVNKVEELIKNLPEKDNLSLNDEDELKNALDSYNDLSEHGKDLVDDKLEQKLNELKKEMEELIAKSFTPEIIDGKEQTIDLTKQDGPATFRSNAPIGQFVKVLVDGNEVDRNSYDIKEGSTIVELRKSYLNTLEAGTHTLSIVSTNGTATTTFTIASSVPAGVFVGIGIGAAVLVAVIIVVISVLKKQNKEGKKEAKPAAKEAVKENKKPAEKKEEKAK